MTYSVLFQFFKILFGSLAVLWAIAEALEWRARRKASAWCKRDLEARGIYIDVPPAPDERDSIGQFRKIMPRSER